MNTRLLNGCRHVAYRSPLTSDLVGAAVFQGEHVLGAAWDLHAARARQRAVSEAVERSAFDARPGDTVVRTAAELGASALPLRDAVRYAPSQLLAPDLAAYRWTEHTPTSWTPATRLGRPDEPLFVPTDLVHLRRTAADAVLLRPVSSAGTAARPTYEEALLHALVECVERHVLALTHRRGVRPVRVDTAGHPRLDAIARPLDGAGVRLTVGLLPPSFGIRVAVAALMADGAGRPAVAVGSGAAFQAGDAMVAAALEAVQIFHFAWQLLHRRTPVPQVPRTAAQRALWWAARHGRPADDRAAELFADTTADTAQKPSLPWSTPGENDRTPGRAEGGGAGRGAGGEGNEPIAGLVALLEHRGHVGAALDITPADALASGPRVARVVLPTLLLPPTDDLHPFLAAPCDPGPPVSALPHPYA